MKNILFRINQIAENEGIKITALETKIGASKGVLSRALNNNTDIQSKWITKIVENYPKYNSEWLLTGNGKMLKEEIKPSISENTDDYKKLAEYTIDMQRREIERLNAVISKMDYAQMPDKSRMVVAEQAPKTARKFSEELKK